MSRHASTSSWNPNLFHNIAVMQSVVHVHFCEPSIRNSKSKSGLLFLLRRFWLENKWIWYHVWISALFVDRAIAVNIGIWCEHSWLFPKTSQSLLEGCGFSRPFVDDLEGLDLRGDWYVEQTPNKGNYIHWSSSWFHWRAFTWECGIRSCSFPVLLLESKQMETSCRTRTPADGIQRSAGWWLWFWVFYPWRWPRDTGRRIVTGQWQLMRAGKNAPNCADDAVNNEKRCMLDFRSPNLRVRGQSHISSITSLDTSRYQQSFEHYAKAYCFPSFLVQFSTNCRTSCSPSRTHSARFAVA